MKVVLSTLTSGTPEPLRGEYDGEALGLNTQDVEFVEPIQFEGTGEKADGIFLVKGKLRSRWRETCSRCLARAERTFEAALDLTIPIEIDQREVDFTPEIREETILSYPVKFLCKEDCKGLCSVCGSNLNMDDCGCDRRSEGEHPFKILKNLKKEKENA